MRKFAPLIAIAALAAGFAAVVWAYGYRQRATEAEVTRAIYREFGPGPRIICAAQDGNGSRWNCRSAARWGDDPNCRQVFVNLLGSMDIRHQTVACEG
ncbi:MAG TPA: hypothetical protein VJN72_02220 [Gaiellales bacterium]|nr:hypothetical protein [Gaiellales bacterium]